MTTDTTKTPATKKANPDRWDGEVFITGGLRFGLRRDGSTYCLGREDGSESPAVEGKESLESVGRLQLLSQGIKPVNSSPQRANAPFSSILGTGQRVTKHPDDNLWIELAKKYGCGLPQFETALTTGGMERFLHRLKIPLASYLAWTEEKTIKVFGQNNPTWTLRAWVGLLLEALENGDVQTVQKEKKAS